MIHKTHAIAGVAGLTLALLSGTALAKPPLLSSLNYGTPPNFSTDALTSGTVTFPGGVAYASNPEVALPANGGSYQVTFTLPAGVTFTTNPTATVSADLGATAVLTTGGSGSASATFVITDTVLAPTPLTITLGSFSVTGATALLQPVPALGADPSTNTFLISAQAAGAPGGSAINDSTPVTTALATSTPSIAISESVYGAEFAENSSTIDINAPSAGTMFLPGDDATNNGVDGLAGDLGELIFTLVPGVDASDAAFAPPTSLTVTVNGALTNIATVALGPTGDGQGCAATPADGSPTGTVSGNGATLSNVPSGIVSTAMHFCLYATGTGIISAGAVNLSIVGNGYNFPIAPDPDNQVGLFNTTYNGAVYSFNYVVAPTSNYATYVRLVNSGANDQIALGSITADGGATSVQLATVTVPANSSLLVPLTQFTNGTAVSFDSTDRAAVTLLTGIGVSADPLLVNPDGTVTEIATAEGVPPPP